jgi:TniQ
MSNDNLETYEMWDMTVPVVPPRSRLFHISPVGFGTSLVECLTSYFSRVAQAHSVSPGALNRHEVTRFGMPRQNIFSCGIKARARSFTAGINGTGSLAADFVSAVGKLTARNDLQYLTMIPWRSLFPSPMLMRGVAAWCPVCLASWQDAGKAVYVPLLWTLEVVKFCPYHRHPLRLTCPHCALPQPLLGQRSWVGFCTRCKRWLGSDSGKDNPERYSVLHQETPEWEIWVAGQIADLIEAAFGNPPLVTREQLAELVRIGSDLEGLSSFARTLGVSATSVCAWRMGTKNPVLPAYLRLARAFNVRLADLLSGRVSPGEMHSLDFRGVPHWRNLWVRRPTPFNKTKVARQMDEALRELPPPSLRAFHKRNGYHDATLHRHFPDQCQAIQKRFREYREAAMHDRHAQKIAEFRQIAYQLHEQGTELFVNRVLKRMSVPKSLDYRIAHEVLTEIKREILANRKALGKPCGKMAKQSPSPDALRAQTE